MIDWTLAATVVIAGLLIVFAALIILIAVVTVMGKVAGSTGGREKKPSAPAGPPQGTSPVPSTQGGIPEETVAVISAAVACAMEESAPGTAYRVASIRRSRDPRPVWGFAGMQQNTRPF